MPTNEELLKMDGVGVRIDIVPYGWQTTVLRQDADGRVHEETWPVRVTFDLAHRDQRRFAPFVHLCQWQKAMCFRRLMPLACGLKK